MLRSRRSLDGCNSSVVSKEVIIRLLFGGRRNRVDMSLGRRIPSVANVTLGALKSRIGFLLLKLVVQYSIRGCFNVAAGARSSASPDLSSRLRIERVQRRDIVAADAAQAGVRDPLVPELCGVAPAPSLDRKLVFYSHRSGKLGIEIVVRLCHLNLFVGRQELMARIAIGRSRLQAFLRMTGKTHRVRRSGLERPLLQPEGVVPQILWRLGYILVIRLALRLISLMADRAAFRVALFSLRLWLRKQYLYEKTLVGLCLVLAYQVDMFIVREADSEF